MDAAWKLVSLFYLNSFISHFKTPQKCNFTFYLCCVAVWQPQRPSISHLRNISDKQSLLVSWLVNHNSLVGDIYEIQIGRTENHTVIYNVSTEGFVAMVFKDSIQ